MLKDGACLVDLANLSQVVTNKINILIDGKFGHQTTLDSVSGRIQEHSTHIVKAKNPISASEDDVTCHGLRS